MTIISGILFARFSTVLANVVAFNMGPSAFSDRGCLLFQVGLVTGDLPRWDLKVETVYT